MLLLNRVLWLAVAAAVLVLLHRTFRFAHPDGGGRRRKGGRAIVDAPARAALAGGDSARRRHVRTPHQAVADARRRAPPFGDVVAGRAFRVTLLGVFGCVLLLGWNVTETVFDTSTWPVTHLVAGTVLSAANVHHSFAHRALRGRAGVEGPRRRDGRNRRRRAGAGGLVLLGRFLALVAMIATFQVAFMTGGVLMQALQGYYHFELGLYLRILFGFNFADYVLLAALAMTIHVLVNHKYVGHIVALLAGVFTSSRRASGSGQRLAPLFRHHLLLYGSDPGWKYSDMNGFGPFAAPFVWFKLYWAAWALLLGVVAALFWVRGREPGLRRRFALARARFIGPVARVGRRGDRADLALGGFIFYNTNVLNEYRTRDQAGSPQAEYEKRYARFEKTPQPTITDAEAARGDLSRPARRRPARHLSCS